MKQRALLPPWAFLLLLLVAGCSKHPSALTRETASQHIQAAAKNPGQTLVAEVSIADQDNRINNLGDFRLCDMLTGMGFATKSNFWFQDWGRRVQGAIYFTTANGEANARSKGWWKEKDKLAFGEYPTHEWVIPVGTKHVMDITGISSAFNAAVVEFRYRYEPTEIGRTLVNCLPEYVAKALDPASVRNGRAEFALYDDGWRMGDVNW